MCWSTPNTVNGGTGWLASPNMFTPGPNGTGPVKLTVNVPSPGTRIGAHVSVGKTLRQEEILRRGVVIQAVGSTQYRLPGSSRVECETDARSQIIPVTFVERIQTLAHANQAGVRQEVRDHVRLLRERPRVFVPQAEIEGEPLIDLPIVL